jgi:hypothetical protein
MKIERFRFPGLYGCVAWCDLERVELTDGRVVVIVSEREDNPGVSVTNFAEELATILCHRYSIEPKRLVWIEHYPAGTCPVCNGTGRRHGGKACCAACRGSGRRRERATYDLVTFMTVPFGDDWRFQEPKWRPMSEVDWKALGLPLRHE